MWLWPAAVIPVVALLFLLVLLAVIWVFVWTVRALRDHPIPHPGSAHRATPSRPAFSPACAVPMSESTEINGRRLLVRPYVDRIGGRS